MYKKLSVTLFVMLSLLVTQFAWAQTLRDQDSKDVARITDEKVNLPYQTIYFDNTEDVLFDNSDILPASSIDFIAK